MRRADFSRAEPQIAPQDATSVSGTPQSRTAKRKGIGNTGCTRVTGRELKGTRGDSREHLIANGDGKY